MTIANGRSRGASNGGAYLISRSIKSPNGSRLDWRNCLRNESCRVTVSFNTRDELELKTSADALDSHSRIESFKIDEIIECYGGDAKDSNSVLVLEVFKNQTKEEIVLNFDREQESRRTLFTYKYFKMRNRLTSSDSSSEGSASPSPSNKSALSNYAAKVSKHHFDDGYAFKSLDYIPSQKEGVKEATIEADSFKSHGKKQQHQPEYDLMHVTDNNGVTHMSVESKNDIGEIDGVIYTDVDYDSVDFTANSSSSDGLETPQKPLRRRQPLKRIKGRAPPPPLQSKESHEAPAKGQQTGNVKEKPKEATNFGPKAAPQPLTKGLMGSNGYESDREEWRSRSTFSSSAFHSLARPARRALAAYYRLNSVPAPAATAPAPMMKPSPRNPKNLQNTIDFAKSNYHPEYVILSPLRPVVDNKRNSLPLQHQDLQQKQTEHRYGKMLFNKEYKRNPLSGSMTYLNISNRLYGLTDKLKEFSSNQHLNTINNNNMKQNWSMTKTSVDKETKGLKPVIKKTSHGSSSSSSLEGSKRPVVRTCSNEPPKKVTFSAFATVQVV